MTVTASLVTYKTPESVVTRLRESCAAENVAFRIVDNTVDNVGFVAGHNKAIREAIEKGSKYHFVINPRHHCGRGFGSFFTKV